LAGYVYVDNGDVTATAANGAAYVVHANSVGPNNASIDSAGIIKVSGATGATGLSANSASGTVTVTGNGAIDVTATAAGATTFGIYAYSLDGLVTVDSYDNITAASDGFAYGIYAASYGGIDVYNSGDIVATSQGADFGA